MTTPRTTRLFRAAGLRAFQRAIVSRIPTDPVEARASAVIVPTRSAAEELRRTIEQRRLLGEGGRDRALVMPDVLPRDDFYAALHARLPGAPALLTPFDREVLLRRSAREAQIDGVEPPFNPRPGLMREVLALYDELRRRHRTVADFDRLLTDDLAASAEDDRGAARLLQQTHFLVTTFERFERAIAGSHASEHDIRELAIASPAPLYRHVIVTVGDQAADPHGLWTADFDVLARLPGLEYLDVVATDGLLDSGFYGRLHDSLLPGIEDATVDEDGETSLPVLFVPSTKSSDEFQAAFRCRDREEELAEFARMRKVASSNAPAARTAIVYQRPLPYLYLARQVFDAAGIPWQAVDALPLAAEPFAAAVDLLFSTAAADFTRGSLIALLGSPHFRFDEDARPLTRAEIHALDGALVTAKFLGGIDGLARLADARSERGLRAAVALARELDSAMSASAAQDQIRGVLAFIAAHERLPDRKDAWYGRHLRARGAVLSALEMLAAAHAAHDPLPLSVHELSGSVRRWIEAQTFSPRSGTTGLRLLDARAAAYADIDELRLVGLIDTDWPERHARSIFYPQTLLSSLGWPSEQERLSAARARFQDLLKLPGRRVSLSFCTLEDDAIVSPTPLLEDIDQLALRTERFVEAHPARVFTHEALAMDPVVPAALSGTAQSWLDVRCQRSFDDARFRGTIAPRAPAAYAVSALERYLECPFKYFASRLLRLEDEPDEEAWMTQQERGRFVHEVFEAFFTVWQGLDEGAITPDNLVRARATFHEVAEAHISKLPEADRALERTLLLGSAAAPGLAERAFAFEIDDESAVVERRLEYELKGTFAFADDAGSREVALRCKADRIDLLEGGRLRIVDYKLGNAPDADRSLQLSVYGVCAQQALHGQHGRSWTLARASYIAFKAKNGFADLKPLDSAMREGQARLLGVIDGIERGEFPVRPAEPFRCTWCAFPSVCRKDYVGDE